MQEAIYFALPVLLLEISISLLHDHARGGILSPSAKKFGRVRDE